MQNQHDFPTRQDLIKARKKMMQYRSYWLKNYFEDANKILEIETDFIYVKLYSFPFLYIKLEFNEFMNEQLVAFEEDYTDIYKRELTPDEMRTIRENWNKFKNDINETEKFKNKYTFFVKNKLDEILVFPKGLSVSEITEKNQMITAYIDRIIIFCRKFHMQGG